MDVGVSGVDIALANISDGELADSNDADVANLMLQI